MQQTRVYQLAIIALFAAFISVLAQISIPTPFGIPITGQTFAIGLAATVLGARKSTLATIVYIFLGLIGLPVFAQMQAGAGIIFGPTGGFLIGFIPTTYVIGQYLEKTHFNFIHALIANILGMFITLFIGVLWLKWIASLSLVAAFAAGFTPFILGGLIKAILSAFLGITIRERLIKAKLLKLKVS